MPHTPAVPLPGLGIPLVAAPMAGGASTPALVTAAARAGAFGFLAGGYKSPAVLGEEMAVLRAAGTGFGVNLFAPHPVAVDPRAFAAYRDRIRPDAERLGVDLGTGAPVEDDDHWRDKVDLLLEHPVPVVGFTFGLPDRAAASALRAAGSLLAQTVTSGAEALLAAEAGADLLIVQAAAAGGHSGVFDPAAPPADRPLAELLAEVAAAVPLPLVAAGGIATPDAVAAALHAGAGACAVGTVLLRSDESGAHPVHRAALARAAASDTGTVVTRAFTGRPARALPNAFTAAHSTAAPLGYPALHHLTGPLRKAAAATADPDRLHLWAGTGHRHASASPTAAILTHLASRA